VGLLAWWLAGSWGALRAPADPLPSGGSLLLVVALSVAFRLPLVWQAAAGYVTADGALSGILALHVRDGIAHDVFVPGVPYSGSLKAHLTAPLAAAMDPARAFALVSVFFYAGFVAGVHRLGRLLAPGAPAVALAAGLYAAFAPPFVTHYSLSNDGNYVEVLALGTWALALAATWMDAADEPFAATATLAGALLGLAFWCHLLALIPLVAVAIVLAAAVARRRGGFVSLAAFALAFGVADVPGLLWNAANGWESAAALQPGEGAASVDPHGPGLAARAGAIFTDQLPVLLGYDSGYPRGLDLALRALAGLSTVAAIVAIARGVLVLSRRREPPALGVLLLFTAVNLAMVLGALRFLPGNPRYLLFLVAPVAVLLAWAWTGSHAGRWLLAGLVAFGALGSLGQAVAEIDSDRRLRGFVRDLAAEGVRFCHTDFYLATPINFLSQETIVCSAKLGPTRTEYFFEYRARAEAAPDAAFVAVNTAQAEKIERRLERLGVAYERRDLMKPVLLRLSRKVDPQELFPTQSFGLR
jgi:hypothetical protein